MILTTITPYWNRPGMLERWLRCLRAAQHPEVQHLIFGVNEEEPYPGWNQGFDGGIEWQYLQELGGPKSIGHYHNLGASLSTTEWIMKLDIDCMPNVRYFDELITVLNKAKPKQWFNGGMFYMNRSGSNTYLDKEVTEKTYSHIMTYRKQFSANPYLDPAATNFICRRQEYLDLGGCLEGFKGYGWEDYQQIYMLERNYLGHPPFAVPTIDNVTQQCRNVISRPRATELWKKSWWLCLLHCWHPGSSDPKYKSPEILSHNRRLLYQYVISHQ